MTTAVADPPPAKHTEPVQRPRLAKLLRVLAIPIVIFWVLVAVVTNVFLPSLDDVTADNAGPLVARDAPSAQAAIHQGNDFDESNYTSVAVLLLETKDRKLGEQDHQYYNEVVRRLLDDTKHVASVQDLWGKPVTMSGSQSADAEATTLTIRPTGDLGSSEANKSIEAIRDVVAKVPKPDGLSAYITGPAPLAADTLHATDKSLVKLTIVTVILIVILLLIAYRSITIALIPLFGVLTTLAVARGIISFLVGQGVIEISSFASNLLVSLVLGASTDYAIFYLGRYQEARQRGEDKESSYYESVANVPHVILGSGIAISGATLCLSLTHLDYFRTLGPPCAVSMVVAVLSALTLGPALLTLGSKIGWIQPRKKRANPVWRKVGTVIARWPVPMIALAALIIPLCMLGWTTYKVSYNDRDFAPASVEASTGYAAADKHFPKSWLNNDIVYVKSDHDMRNTTDMISLDRVAKAIIRTPGVALVQSVTRPNGRPLEHASLPYALGSTGTKIGENIGFLRDRVADIDTLAAKTGPSSTQPSGSKTSPNSWSPAPTYRGNQPNSCRPSPTKPAIIWPTSTTSSGPCGTTSIGSRTATTSQYAGPFDRSTIHWMASTGSPTNWQYGARHHDYRRCHPTDHSPDRDGGVEPAGDADLDSYVAEHAAFTCLAVGSFHQPVDRPGAGIRQRQE